MDRILMGERKSEMRLLLTILVLALATAPAVAQIPRLMNYQGVLTDDVGVVVSDGTYSMTFRIYDVPSGGSPLWEETFDVIVSKGIFNTILGYTTPIDLSFDEPLYLGLAVEGGAELSPRRLFVTNAHAFSALSVFGAENVFPSSGNVGIGATDPDAPLTIRIDNTDANAPALLIENTGNQSMIDFKMATVTEARIRKAAAGDLFLGTVTGNAISFMMGNTSVSRMLPDGSFGIDNLSPVEKLDVNGAIRLGNTAGNNAGTIRWDGNDFEGYDGSNWQSLTSGGGSSLPSGSAGQTLRHNGADWVAADNLTNTGTSIGINTSSPAYPLHVVQPSGQVGLRVDGYDASWSSIYINANNGNPNYGYLRESSYRGGHYLDAGFAWNLELDGNPALHIEPNGWTTFGGVGLAESMNIPGAIRVGNTTGSNGGSIRFTGSDFEGYVGGMWHSLTAAGLPAATNGQTLRYDNGWVATSNIFNSGTDVGIGTASPTSNLHVYEDIDGYMGIRIENPNTGSGSGEEISFMDENGQLAGIRLYDDTSPSTYAGTMAIFNNRPSGSLLLRTGGLNRMKIQESGTIETYNSSGNAASQILTDMNGGMFRIMDETGANHTVLLEANADGTGGYLAVTRNAVAEGFAVDGNFNGTEATRMMVAGPARMADFDMSSSGNASVVLPADAIGSAELFNEPGVGYDWRTTSYALSSGPAAIASRSITVPAAGYVLVIGTAEVHANHTNGVIEYAAFGVSDNASTFPSAQDVLIRLNSTLGSGYYYLPVTVQGIFTVAGPGTYTYYMLGREDVGDFSATKMSFSVLYVPTSYGTVDALALANGDTPSDEDPALERAESKAANDRRIESELAAMRERIAALERELGNK